MNKSKSAMCEEYLYCYTTTCTSERNDDGKHMSIESVDFQCSKRHESDGSVLQVSADIV
jgi:hypothetical protein